MKFLENLLVFCLTVCVEMLKQDGSDLSCFSSSDPAAQKMQQMYDDDDSTGHVWLRNGSLPHCKLTSITSIGSSNSPECEVCTSQSVKLEMVYVFCNKLAATKKLVFEYPNGHLHFNQTDCPRPPADETHTTQRSHLYIVLPTSIFIIFIIIIGVLVYRSHLQREGLIGPSEGETSSHSSA